jgi:hypothetical protein
MLFSVVLVSGCDNSKAPASAIENSFRAEVPADVGSNKITTVETDWFIDAINGKPHDNKAITVAKGSTVTIGGWAVDRSRKVVPKTIYVKLISEVDGKEYYIKAKREKRLDVATVLKINEYENAGFNTVGDTKELAPGNYTVGILQIDDAQAIASVSKIQIVLQ